MAPRLVKAFNYEGQRIQMKLSEHGWYFFVVDGDTKRIPVDVLTEEEQGDRSKVDEAWDSGAIPHSIGAMPDPK
tara:strand:- start:220 stop:441 length:222 start_codon:yes stop_codon:yes gene_type:complete